MLVLETSTLVIRTIKEAVETAETTKTAKAVKIAKTGKYGKESKGGENPRSNLIQVPYIRYPITFRK